MVHGAWLRPVTDKPDTVETCRFRGTQSEREQQTANLQAEDAKDQLMMQHEGMNQKKTHTR